MDAADASEALPNRALPPAERIAGVGALCGGRVPARLLLGLAGRRSADRRARGRSSHMNGWDTHSLARLRQVAIDLTALSATVEVLRVRLPQDVAVERIAGAVDSLILHLNEIVEQLRER